MSQLIEIESLDAMELPNLDKDIREQKPVTIRMDTDVIEFFQGTGKGWHGRVNALCRWYMEKAKKEEAEKAADKE